MKYNRQWHLWRAWHPVFVADPLKYGEGHWVWLNTIYRRWTTEGFERLGYWQYCLDDFQMIILNELDL